MAKSKLPPVDVWALISDGIDGPLYGGFRRGIKHSSLDITEEEIQRIIEQQNIYLMNWFAETFRFDDGHDEEEE